MSWVGLICGPCAASVSSFTWPTLQLSFYIILHKSFFKIQFGLSDWIWKGYTCIFIFISKQSILDTIIINIFWLCLSSLLNEKGIMGIDMKYRSPNVWPIYFYDERLSGIFGRQGPLNLNNHFAYIHALNVL